MSREVVDARAVAIAGTRLRDCGEHVPRPAGDLYGVPALGALSVGAEVARFEAVWGDGLSALRAELGLLASALQQASWARQDLEGVNARLLSHAPATPAGSAATTTSAPAVGGQG